MQAASLYGLSVLGVSVADAAELLEQEGRRAFEARLCFSVVTPAADRAA